MDNLLHELKLEAEQIRIDLNNYNLYQSGCAKETIRSLSQEVNWATCLTQMGHNSKEYSKGMNVLLEASLNNIQQKNAELEKLQQQSKKLKKTLEQKEQAFSDLEEEIEIIQRKESELNKKKEEIFRY
jgi:CII-binding regulator of phage lambda lysogenization HflD